ncbi:MAG: hypothetical protein OEY03_03255 [Rhizobacter sp.]|nr:hypothetical protein [Rhizobacter sp.]
MIPRPSTVGHHACVAWPDTAACVARSIIHPYKMLGVPDENNFPLRDVGVRESPASDGARGAVMSGKACPECGNRTVIQEDGCDIAWGMRGCAGE